MDIVGRLKKHARPTTPYHTCTNVPHTDLHEAAAEIERLRAERAWRLMLDRARGVQHQPSRHRNALAAPPTSPGGRVMADNLTGWCVRLADGRWFVDQTKDAAWRTAWDKSWTAFGAGDWRDAQIAAGAVAFRCRVMPLGGTLDPDVHDLRDDFDALLPDLRR